MTTHYPMTFVRQADATLSQANPVSGTSYAVLGTAAAPARNVRIYSIWAKVTWSVDTTRLDVFCVIDGDTFQWYVDPTSAQDYYCRIVAQSVPSAQSLETTELQKSFLLEGKSVYVYVVSTGGTANPLACNVKYAVMK